MIARYSASEAMLQPHSFLWHYLWVASDILLAILAILTWRRRLHNGFPAFFVYLVFESILELTLYGMDVVPGVSAHSFWSVAIAGLLIEALIKLAIIWEIFASLVRQEPAVAEIGRRRIVSTGVGLLIFACVAAMRAPIGVFPIISYSWILGQSIYLVEAGILLFIFLFAASFQLTWNKQFFGIALGLSLSACVGLGIFAICANGIFFEKRYLLDFLEMGTYHICVLIWFYFLLSPAQPFTVADRETHLERMSRSDGGWTRPHNRVWMASMRESILAILLRIPNNAESEVTFTTGGKG